MKIIPQHVVSPKNKLKNLKVIFENQEYNYSIAQMTWEENLAYGIRWNGGEKYPLGSPHSNGHPTWFILPNDIAEIVVEYIKNKEK